MPNTYVALRTETVATTTASVSFSLSGISGYTDLVLVVNGTASGDAGCRLQFNGDTGTNYSSTLMYAIFTTSGVISARDTNAVAIGGLGRLGTSPGTAIINIQNYSNSSVNKTVLAKGGTTDVVMTTVGLWRNTAAITSIVVSLENSRTFSTGTTLSLYGIANADQGAAKATGGIITEDSQYWYHTFGASGAFIPKQSLTCDVLVVAGGGGGGGNKGGGGGAGGLRAATSQSLTAISYNVTVGAGGSASSTSGRGGSGVDSAFSTIITSTGGGGGGGGDATGSVINGLNGGSGGGSAWNGTGTPVAGLGNTPSTSPSQGSNGGNADAVTTAMPGGGGGAGGSGFSGIAGATQAQGGVGTATYSSWGAITGVGQNVNGTVYFAGGGGGGSNALGQNPSGGLGGGGTGGSRNESPTFIDNATRGVTNTGGGGGGGSTGASAIAGKAGGSGVVIIRYSK